MFLSRLDIVSICIYSISGIFGILGNAILLAAIKYRSPASWKSYPILLANCALIDLIACISNFLSMERFVPYKDVTVSIYLGPCTLLSGFFCHIMHSIMVHTCTQSFFFIAISFFYRLYVLARSPPSKRKMILFCVAIYLPTLSVLIMTFYTNDPPEEVRSALQLYHPEHEQFEGYVIEGHVDLQPRILSLFVQAYVFTPIVPLCTIVFVVRQKILGTLKSNANVMTTRTKAMHKTLVKVLTMQASLPILFFCSLICIMLVKRQVYVAPLVEYAIFWNLSYMPALSPFITLYNITPYREFVYRRPRVTISIEMTNSITKMPAE